MVTVTGKGDNPRFSCLALLQNAELKSYVNQKDYPAPHTHSQSCWQWQAPHSWVNCHTFDSSYSNLLPFLRTQAALFHTPSDTTPTMPLFSCSATLFGCPFLRTRLPEEFLAETMRLKVTYSWAQLQTTWLVQLSSAKSSWKWDDLFISVWCCNVSNSNSVQALKSSSAFQNKALPPDGVPNDERSLPRNPWPVPQ